MRKILLLFLIITFFLSCSKRVDLSKINTLNGYWQIDKVEDSNGNKKEYKINEIYDYFSIKEKKGIHKKVTWQPNGKFLVNNLQDSVKIVSSSDEVFITFSSKYGNHKEKLSSLSDLEMTLISPDGFKFYYKKVILQ